MSSELAHLIKQAQSGDTVAFARLLSSIEQQGSSVLVHDELLNPKHLAFRVGITGPPGAGKSTLISELLSDLISKKLKVGVLAIDPSSPFSQGAILGDRIRFANENTVDQVFIRSLGTRGSLGGLSSAAYLMLRAFDLCGFDIVLIETVGVGQVEVEVMNVADLVALVLVPESGDSIQVMKSGIMEVADFFIVNKSDRPGAESLAREIENHIEQDEAANKKVFLLSALQKRGIDSLCTAIEEQRVKPDWRKRVHDIKKMRAEAFALIRAGTEKQIYAKTSQIQTQEDLRNILLKNN